MTRVLEKGPRGRSQTQVGCWGFWLDTWDDGGAEIGKPGGIIWRKDDELGLHRSSLRAGGSLGTTVIRVLGKS